MVYLITSPTLSRHLQYMSSVHNSRELLLPSLLLHSGLLSRSRYITPLAPKLARRSHLEQFHSREYIDILDPATNGAVRQRLLDEARERAEMETNSRVDFGRRRRRQKSMTYEDLKEGFNLVDDCAVPDDEEKLRRFFDYNLAVVGASLTAAAVISGGGGGGGGGGGIDDDDDDGGSGNNNNNNNNNNDNDNTTTTNTGTHIAIAWSGGRHHAHRSSAGGFCYVNDTVLALLHLRRKHRKILYLDIDIHHSDGVQEAFYDSQGVMTVSFHRHEEKGGFFPAGEGSSSYLGRGKGVGYNLNVVAPLGCPDDAFLTLFTSAFTGLWESYSPSCVVLAVGADGLKGDPVVGQDGWRLTSRGLGDCVKLVSRYCGSRGNNEVDGNNNNNTTTTPLLILGGGGYNDVNAARTFATCTVASVEGVRANFEELMPPGIPESDPYFDRYSSNNFMMHTDEERTREMGEEGEPGYKEREEGLKKARGEVRDAISRIKGKALLGKRRYEADTFE